MSFQTKVHSFLVYVTRQHTAHLLTVNIKYWCGIFITEDNKKICIVNNHNVLFFYTWSLRNSSGF